MCGLLPKQAWVSYQCQVLRHERVEQLVELDRRAGCRLESGYGQYIELDRSTLDLAAVDNLPRAMGNRDVAPALRAAHEN